MEGKRLEKVNRLIQKELGDIFQKELKPKVPMLMITVTHVRVTSDLGYANVYLSVFGVDDKKKVVEEVAQNGKAIRGLLGNRVRHQMRVVPELRFFEDDSLDYIENIDNLLHPDK
ncbi:MAG: 30S ribosome-binding factor RbfA [Bacteroidales bacterium]|nr:30S ribosome-binding factor RbfA [Bacteroidales bacterium]